MITMEVYFLLNIFFNQQKITDFVEKENFGFHKIITIIFLSFKNVF